MNKIAGSFIVICGLMCLLTACSITGGTNYGTGGVSQFNDGYVMAVQASPDAPALTIFVENSPWDTGMILGSNTYYAQAVPGTYTFSVAQTNGSSAAPLDTNTINIAANAYYTYFIIDSFKTLQTAVLQDNFLRPSGDSFYVRFLNFCPQTKLIFNLYDSAHNTFWASNRTFNDQTAVATNALFGEHFKGTYTLFLSNSVTKDTVKQQFTFNGGYVYTLYAAGLQGRTDSTKLSIKSYQNYPQR